MFALLMTILHVSLCKHAGGRQPEIRPPSKEETALYPWFSKITQAALHAKQDEEDDKSGRFSQ